MPELTKLGEHTEVIDAKKGISRVFYDVTIKSEPICVAGWDFIASIDISDDPDVGRIINRVPGVLSDIDLPAKYRTTTDYCDHCQKSRRRNTVFVVKKSNSDTDEWMQIGRNCLGLFLGGVDPTAVVQQMEMLISLNGLCSGAQGYDFFGVAPSEHLDLRTTLTFTGFIIDKKGWLGRAKARELAQNGVVKQPTADVVQTAYFVAYEHLNRDIKDLLYDFENLEQAQLTKYEEAAEAAIDWIRSTDDEQNSDFLHNLVVVCKQDSFAKKHLGLACSLLISHANTLGRIEKLKAEAEKARDLKHIGTIGKRETFHLTVKDIKFLQNNFGSTMGVFFTDKNGNKAVWWATNNPDVHIGVTYEVISNVKAHDSYKNVPNTVLTRAKIVGVIGNSP